MDYSESDSEASKDNGVEHQVSSPRKNTEELFERYDNRLSIEEDCFWKGGTVFINEPTTIKND